MTIWHHDAWKCHPQAWCPIFSRCGFSTRLIFSPNWLLCSKPGLFETFCNLGTGRDPCLLCQIDWIVFSLFWHLLFKLQPSGNALQFVTHWKKCNANVRQVQPFWQEFDTFAPGPTCWPVSLTCFDCPCACLWCACVSQKIWFWKWKHSGQWQLQTMSSSSQPCHNCSIGSVQQQLQTAPAKSSTANVHWTGS